MDERSKLGRGLKEISQIYLSGGSRDEIRPSATKNAEHRARTIIRVCHPGSCLVQSFFLSNLALELARNQFPVFVWDCMDSRETGIESVMRSLVLEQKENEAATVRLYGLPDILIHGPVRHDENKLTDLINIIHSSDNDCYLLVNADNSLTGAMNDALIAEHILLSGTDQKSLLQCYAHIRVILGKGGPCCIFIVFDGVDDGRKAQNIFNLFATYIEKKHGITIYYLGSLSHDKYLQSSVEEAKPLMLLQNHSETKDNMISISKNFINSRTDHLNRS